MNTTSRFRIGVFGASGVGKTTFIHQYIFGRVLDAHRYAVHYSKLVELETESIMVEIIETKSDPSWIPDCDAVIFVFSSMSVPTFSFIQEYANRRRGLVALVATMSDGNPHSTSYEDGFNQALQIGAGYFYFSAFRPYSAREPFNFLLGRFVVNHPAPTLVQELPLNFLNRVRIKARQVLRRRFGKYLPIAGYFDS
ncbi:uncharacterized protein Z519_12098 [Cladophialophora bantiana CBS 173.52]|uniref:Uncharacterized protein n=1 Tax=Cladophialophora bantiana (strain ATCC 10958 / CBS 173.52 / CDC B-1940 / NIH 8579) TaxID=1442370 RepID=A0A0D2EAN3_CLAB1|nr:uncharacterized protein Z519_12098 [Cladophialophora bantiana CBS 173.52]KIW87196.1 hypothetical protein Z519_12098 [Cladophialophora bantiana CBS 173.52]